MTVEPQSQLRQYQGRKRDLGERVYFADEQRLHFQTLRQGLIEDRTADDEHVPEDDKNHQPIRHMGNIAKADINARQQSLVGKRIKISAQDAAVAKPAREKSIKRIRDARKDKKPECQGE